MNREEANLLMSHPFNSLQIRPPHLQSSSQSLILVANGQGARRREEEEEEIKRGGGMERGVVTKRGE